MCFARRLGPAFDILMVKIPHQDSLFPWYGKVTSIKPFISTGSANYGSKYLKIIAPALTGTDDSSCHYSPNSIA
jgi:hypothetical protein